MISSAQAHLKYLLALAEIAPFVGQKWSNVSNYTGFNLYVVCFTPDYNVTFLTVVAMFLNF